LVLANTELQYFGIGKHRIAILGIGKDKNCNTSIPIICNSSKVQLIFPYPCSDGGGHKQQTTINKSGSGRIGGGGSSKTRTTAATMAGGTMALIAATMTTAAAVATVAATAAEVWRRRGGVRRDGCVGCRQMVVARKSQKPWLVVALPLVVLPSRPLVAPLSRPLVILSRRRPLVV
jgi:hypothetical protein